MAAILPLRADPAVEANPPNVYVAKISGILLRITPLKGCPKCAPLLHKVTHEGEGTVRSVIMQEQYMEHFDGYLEPIGDDSALFRTLTEQVPSAPTVARELLCYLGSHPKSKGEPVSAHDQEPSPKQAVPMVSQAKVIEWLLDVDGRQACTQTEPEDFSTAR